jgi:hydroxymethylpyrimidine pyrophosphatase-like HAD family hydrolase
MGNAHQSLKDIAHAVLSSNDEDGVASYVERLLGKIEAPFNSLRK